MTNRTRLPARRASETFDLEAAGIRYTATLSHFDDGKIGEIFLNATNKAGSGLDDAARDASRNCIDRSTIRRSGRYGAEGSGTRLGWPRHWAARRCARPRAVTRRGGMTNLFTNPFMSGARAGYMPMRAGHGDNASLIEGLIPRRVFRVQDRAGRGPFRPGFSHEWCDEHFARGMEPLPTWGEEFGWDLIERLGLPGEHFGTAVRTVEQIFHWFSIAEQQRLDTLGYNLVSLRVDRILAESKNQLVFSRVKPLAQAATVIRWPS